MPGQASSQTLRQVGSALGVDVIGSVLGSVHRSSFGDTADSLPEGLRDSASGSIGGTRQALKAAQGGPDLERGLSAT